MVSTFQGRWIKHIKYFLGEKKKKAIEQGVMIEEFSLIRASAPKTGILSSHPSSDNVSRPYQVLDVTILILL